MSTPGWALTLAYWLHMLATVVWIGGLAGLSIFVLPAARRSLTMTSYTSLLAEIQKRLDPIGWFCLGLLAGTGLFQMSSNPNYRGFLTIENSWTLVILVKHLLFLGMAGISAYLTWFLLPELRRAAMKRNLSEQGLQVEAQTDGELSLRETHLLRINLALGVLVLALTAAARASG